MKLNVIFGVLLLGFSTSAHAQPKISDTLNPDKIRYISMQELHKIHEIVKKAPIVEEHCYEVPCEKIDAYFQALHNLREDHRVYKKALRNSINISHDQWLQYLDDTFKNETLKWGLITNLRFREAWSNFASMVLDLASLWNAVEGGGGKSPFELEAFENALRFIDVAMQQFNLYVKPMKADAGATFIGTLTSDEWNNLYTTLRSGYDLVSESYGLFKKIDQVAGVSADEIIKLRRIRKANVAAAIAQFVNMYVSYQNKQMKDHIAELDKVLSKNQSVQSQHYEKYVAKRTLYDKIDSILIQIDSMNRYDQLKALQLQCEGSTTRLPRKEISINSNEFGAALVYYRNLLPSDGEILKKSYNGIKNCDEPQKPYRFNVYDGLGKIVNDEVAIRNSYTQKQYGKLNSNQGSLVLYPGHYDIICYGQTNYDKGYRSIAIHKKFNITGNEPPTQTPAGPVVDINLALYGKLIVEVIDDAGAPQNFTYVLTDKATEKSFKWGRKYGKLEIDLEAGEIFDLKVENGFHEKRVKKISIEPRKLTHVKFIYDNLKGYDDNVSITETSTFDQMPKEIKPKVPKPEINGKAPAGWTIGTLYNSNDGNCDQYRGKYIRFAIRNQKIYDMASGTFKDDIIVAPGEKVSVAAPQEGGHFRGYIFNPVDNQSDRHISFWYYEPLLEGWWYAVGCHDGYKPEQYCNNGQGDIGQSSHGECGTLGEPK